MPSCDLDIWPVDLEISWYIKRHVIIVCTKFERNRAIPWWIIDNFANFCTRYVTPWPWPLTSWPWTFVALRVSCVAKFERNRIIHGWVIDDLARFRVQFWGGGGSELTELSQGCMDPTSPTSPGHRAICLTSGGLKSLNSVNLSFVTYNDFFYCWYAMSRCDFDLCPLILNVYSTSGVMCLNSVQNLSGIE